MIGGDRSGHKRESRREHRRADRRADRRETEVPGDAKLSASATRCAGSNAFSRSQAACSGQREKDRVGEPSEHQEPAGLPEQPAERQLVERVKDEGSWKTGARAQQDEEECRGRGGNAKTRRAGGLPACPREPGQRQKAEGRYRAGGISGSGAGTYRRHWRTGSRPRTSSPSRCSARTHWQGWRGPRSRSSSTEWRALRSHRS